MPIQQHKAAAPVCRPYIEPVVQLYEFYRYADIDKAFIVVHVSDWPGKEKLAIKRFDEPAAKYVPYHEMIQAIKDGTLVKFNPSPLIKILDNLKKQA